MKGQFYKTINLPRNDSKINVSFLRKISQWFFLILFLFSFQPSFAQNSSIIVTGTITSADGETIIGGSVIEVGTNLGTTTDVDGRY